MPNKTLDNFAERSDKSRKDLERYWKEAEQAAEEKGLDGDGAYGYIMRIVMRRAGIKGATDPLVDETFKHFKMFMKRAPKWFPLKHLDKEIKLMKKGRVSPKSSPKELKQNFLRYPRIGAEFTMDRKQRNELFLTFEKAINHAGFKLEHGSGKKIKSSQINAAVQKVLNKS